VPAAAPAPASLAAVTARVKSALQRAKRAKTGAGAGVRLRG
jgi:hypothetical protein